MYTLVENKVFTRTYWFLIFCFFGQSDRTDHNGQIIEEYMAEKNLVCLNDGSYTRINKNMGKESASGFDIGVE